MEIDDRTQVLSKLAFCLWRYTVRAHDHVETNQDGNPIKRKYYGFYAVAERNLYRESDDHARGLTAFLRAGWASPHVNRFGHARAGGAVYQGLFRGRPDDIIALNGEPAPIRELACELTYRAKVNGWLTLQPELQQVLLQGAGSARTTIAGLRVEIGF